MTIYCLNILLPQIGTSPLSHVRCYCYTEAAAAAAKSLQSCPTLCDPIYSSPPGSPVPGILQARVLEWDAIAFSTMQKSGGQLLIAPKRMKQLGQSWNDTQLWLYVVVKVKSDAVKNNVTKEPGMLHPWTKVNWASWSKGWQEWTSAP